jgi:DNA polymerase/3'-5' exonuclease PolX
MKHKKIGLLTFHNVYNFGGVLQAYALCYALKNHKIECIDYLQPDLNAKYEHMVFNKSKSFKSNLKHLIKYYLLGIGKEKESKILNFVNSYIPISTIRWYNLKDAYLYGNKYDI